MDNLGAARTSTPPAPRRLPAPPHRLQKVFHTTVGVFAPGSSPAHARHFRRSNGFDNGGWSWKYVHRTSPASTAVSLAKSPGSVVEPDTLAADGVFSIGLFAPGGVPGGGVFASGRRGGGRRTCGDLALSVMASGNPALDRRRGVGDVRRKACARGDRVLVAPSEPEDLAVLAAVVPVGPGREAGVGKGGDRGGTSGRWRRVDLVLGARRRSLQARRSSEGKSRDASRRQPGTSVGGERA